jgi:hypothetical protein
VSRVDDPRLQSKTHWTKDEVQARAWLDSDGLARLVALEKEQLVTGTDDWFHGISFLLCGLMDLELAAPLDAAAGRAVVIMQAGWCWRIVG